MKFGAAVIDDVAQTVMAAVAAAFLQAYRARWQVDLVMSHEKLSRRAAGSSRAPRESARRSGS